MCTFIELQEKQRHNDTLTTTVQENKSVIESLENTHTQGTFMYTSNIIYRILELQKKQCHIEELTITVQENKSIIESLENTHKQEIEGM